MLRTFGNKAHEIWNVADPAQPKLVTRLASGLKDTHKNWWECDTGIAYLVSGVTGWRARRMTEVYDLSDPAKPVKIRDFGLVGQQPGATGAVPTDLHGTISTGPKGNRVYFGYGTNEGGVLQIVDREKLLNGPKEPTPENLRYPQIGRLDMSPLVGAHTAFPARQDARSPSSPRTRSGSVRNIIMIVERADARTSAQEARQLVWFVDVDGRAQPMVGVELDGAGGERELLPARRTLRHAFLATRAWRRSTTRSSMFFTWFNAGVRAVDMRDPYQPKEVGYFIPAITEATESAASRWTARTAARSRSRPTMWRPTTAATSTSSTAPTPACTSSS